MKYTKNILIPSFIGLQYGFNSSIIAGALLFVSKSYSLGSFLEGFLVAVTMAGTCLASLSGVLANYWGRKRVLLLGCAFFLFGSLLTSLGVDFSTILLGRLLIGFGSGIAVVVVPIYLVEQASDENRGSVLNFNQVSVAAGSVFAYAASYFLGFSENWRTMFGIGALIAFVHFFGLFLIPETLSGEQKRKKLFGSSWKKVFDPSHRLRLALIFCLSVFQAFTGASAIFFFAPQVFESAGFSGTQNMLLATMCLGFVYLFAVWISFRIVDLVGRRFLLLISLFGMMCSLFTIAIFSLFHLPYLNTVAVLSILVYVAFYSVGVGPIPSLIAGELSPLDVRGHMMTLMGIAIWASNYVIAVVFLQLVDLISLGGVFLSFGFISLIGWGIFYKFLPETKQKSLAEIEELMTIASRNESLKGEGESAE